MNTQTEIQSALDADHAKLQRTQAATRRANSEPLPGPLAEAFNEPIKVCGFTIRPVVASDFILLKKLNSPLHRQVFAIAEHRRAIEAGEKPKDSKPPKTEYEDEECVEMVYQFVVPLATARQKLRAGRTTFTEAAYETVADVVSRADLTQLLNAVLENFTGSFSTKVRYEGEQKEGEETVFTTQPAAGATASAGGLNTSPASPAEILQKKAL